MEKQYVRGSKQASEIFTDEAISRYIGKGESIYNYDYIF